MNGILFKPDMHLAIREGRKTQTRRLLNPQPFMERGVLRWQPKRNYPKNYRKGMHLPDINMSDHNDLAKLFSPYRVDEVVYIKEACCLWCYQQDGVKDACYKTDEDGMELPAPITHCSKPQKWLSPLFMPAWAARDFIKILGVRAELFRVKQMTPQDIEAEGGEQAVEYLKQHDGKWCWVYTFKEENHASPAQEN